MAQVLHRLKSSKTVDFSSNRKCPKTLY